MSGDVSGLVPLPIYISNRMPGISALGLGNVANGLTPASSAFPTANLAIYMPFILPAYYIVRRLGWMNGATVAATNHIDIGIYTDNGTRVVNTGSTAQGTASALQSATLGTPLKIPPGHYYFGFQCDTTVATFQRVAVPAIAGRLMGFLQQAVGSFGLPAALTAAQYAQSYMPLVWMSDHASF